MLRVAALLVSCIWVGTQATALSCIQPDVTNDYGRAAASEDEHIVVLGDLMFAEQHFPEPEDINEPTQNGAEIIGWFNGHSLSPGGFDRRFERDVTLRFSCAGPWCGGTAPGTHMAFLKREGSSYIMTLGPCGGMVYRDPTEVQKSQAISCMRNKDCRAD